MARTTRPGPLDPIAASIVDLTRDLVRAPSRAGLDEYDHAFAVLARWLERHHIPFHVLDRERGGPIALIAEVAGGRGPLFLLNATIDTADFADAAGWSVPPTAAEIRDGWMYGRGAADSKVGISVFTHVAAALRMRRDELRGTLRLIFDADEHTGGFEGFRCALAHQPGDIAGAMLGYPGFERIGTGGRGFERARVTVLGTAAHSGSGARRGVNAVTGAARFALRLADIELPRDEPRGFPLPPCVTVTEIRGGHGFSVVPDSCHLNVDVRLTPRFDGEHARRLLEGTARQVCEDMPELGGIAFEWLGGWPAYRLPDDSVVARALIGAAEEVLGHPVPSSVVGPSNVGNFLYQQGIEATCGFGVAYRNVHGVDECIDLATVRPVYDVYLRALEDLLGVS